MKVTEDLSTVSGIYNSKGHDLPFEIHSLQAYMKLGKIYFIHRKTMCISRVIKAGTASSKQFTVATATSSILF